MTKPNANLRVCLQITFNFGRLCSLQKIISFSLQNILGFILFWESQASLLLAMYLEFLKDLTIPQVSVYERAHLCHFEKISIFSVQVAVYFEWEHKWRISTLFGTWIKDYLNVFCSNVIGYSINWDVWKLKS